MTDPTPSPLAARAYGRRDAQALALACVAEAGHFDELRGATAPSPDRARSAGPEAGADADSLTASWAQFFDTVADKAAFDLDQRSLSLARQLRDQGVSYNAYGAADILQRPWSLELFPLIIEPDSWQQIEAGVLQRMRLLERVMADVYGPQQMLAQGLLPSALVQGHPGYLRAMHGVKPPGGMHLHIAAFDLARGPEGNWCVVGQRCQAPSGLGYLLENRRAVSSQFPEAFAALRVQQLAGTYRALVDSLKMMSPTGQDAHLALLTPGPYNESYFEHACLARYLGLSLVEGCDLVVRDERLYLKTFKGLVRVHGLLKRVDDAYLDPLELRADSTLGVPGLLQAMRAGNVLVANAPGSAFLESPALLGFLPAMARHLLGEELLMPALPTWWCGERSALEEALPRLRAGVIKPTYRGAPGHASFAAVVGPSLSKRELGEWSERLVQQSEDHTVQAYLPLSQMPTWQMAAPAANTGQLASSAGLAGRVAPRSALLRVFAVSDGMQSWRVLPGGLARVASAGAEVASLQRGGSSADVWALTRPTVDATTSVPPATAASLAQRQRLVSVRAAENLFWLGRYTERAGNALRLAGLTLEGLNGEAPASPQVLAWLGSMALANTLVLPGVPPPDQADRVFERALIASLGSSDAATSVGYCLRALKMAASSVHDWLSPAHWRIVVRAEEELAASCAELDRGGYSAATLPMLNSTGEHLAALSDALTEHMMRDDGWRLLSIGRHLERLGFLADALARGFETASVHTDIGFEAMAALFECTLTFETHDAHRHDIATLLDRLVLDTQNPSSLAWVAQTLRGHLSKLAEHEPGQADALALRVPDPTAWDLAQLCATGRFMVLHDLLLQCTTAAVSVSDAIGRRYFTHSSAIEQSLST